MAVKLRLPSARFCATLIVSTLLLRFVLEQVIYTSEPQQQQQHYKHRGLTAVKPKEDLQSAFSPVSEQFESKSRRVEIDPRVFEKQEDKKRKDSNVVVPSKVSMVKGEGVEKLKVISSEENMERTPRKRSKVFCLVSVKKCGSGALKFFVGKHPSIHLIPNGVIPFGCRDVELLRKAIKNAKRLNPNKSIGFSHHSCTTNAAAFDRMGEERPGRIMLLLCEPSHRAFSDYKNYILHKWFDDLKGHKFPGAIKESIAILDDVKRSLPSSSDVTYGMYLDSLANSTENRLQTLVSRGVYFYDVAAFFARYAREDVLVRTGKQLIGDTGHVIFDLEEHLGVRPVFQVDSFVKNNKTGFYCLKLSTTFCLSSSKSKTTGPGKPVPDPNTMKSLESFYKPYNDQLFRLLGYKLDW